MQSKIITIILAFSLFLCSTSAQQNYRIETSPWAFSWGAGLGSMVPTGGLGDNFNAGFAADTELNIYYNKAFLMINGGFSSNKLAKNILVEMIDSGDQATWPMGSNAMHAFIGANAGVNLYATEEISFYPFAGIGYGFIEPNLKTANSDPVLSALKINSFIWNAGIGVDYNIPDKDYEPGEINRILKVGLRYQFQQPDYEKKVAGFDGAAHWLTLRFVIGSTMPGKVVYY
ncbi:MAG: outer membrane beta-barrel protein [Fermentimonas sp.]|nr:outer membrane beta-barrel protein [Fermentimonas sp.]